jgi:EAL domain-containing protein (putative c-di-GMP-specific phosphodiesterase class I)
LWSLAPKEGWHSIAEGEAVCVEIGPDRRWRSVQELINVLRALLDTDRLEQLRGTWVEAGDRCCWPSGKTLRQGHPIPELAPLDSSPLVGMLENGRLETWYQPVVRVADQSIWGYECLMRGRTPDGSLVLPPRILDWARQERLTFMLDRLSRERHLRSAGQFGLGQDSYLLVNFLPTTIYEPATCLRTTVKAADQAGLNPEQVIFEVVESEQMEDWEHLVSILGFYRRAGFSVALDDVGTGYSGLMMLAELSPDLIKIDRGLVARAPESKLHRGICRSLASLARESGKLTLAEGIETEQQQDTMAALGIDLQQGFLFGRPSPEPWSANAAT